MFIELNSLAFSWFEKLQKYLSPPGREGFGSGIREADSDDRRFPDLSLLHIIIIISLLYV
jgi:hypothetical protein